MRREYKKTNDLYQKLKWIGCDGNQWTHTDIYLTSDTTEISTEFKSELKNYATSSEYLLCCEESNGIQIYYNGKSMMNQTAALSAPYNTPLVYTSKSLAGNKTISSGSSTNTKYGATIINSGEQLHMFGGRGSYNLNFKQRLYYFNIFKNGSLVGKFVPVIRRGDDVVGLLNEVTGNFFENAGTGNFTYEL